MNVLRTFLCIILFSSSIYSRNDFERSLFFGVSSSFAISLGFQEFREINKQGTFGIWNRGDILLIHRPSDKNGNTLSSSFLTHIVFGLSYKYSVSKTVYLFPKLGPAANIYIVPGSLPAFRFGYGISPGIGLIIERFEFGIMSNISFYAPISFAHWIGFEVGLRL
jgi:hypothetical protein